MGYKFAKPREKSKFAFVKVASLVTREIIMTKGFPLDGVFLHTNVTNHTNQMEEITLESTHYAQSLALIIVVKGINTCYAQNHVLASLHTLMGKGNITKNKIQYSQRWHLQPP